MYLLGKFEPDQDNNFVEIESQYANRQGLFLRIETYDAFVKMHAAALEDAVQLTIVSATRNFDSQKYIWERKWSGKTLVGGKNLAKSVNDPVERAKIILRFSSMPGTSRHHWGTDIDLNALNNEYFSTGEGKKIYTWLTENASDFGFCQTYTPKNSARPSGYEEEKWHWSYFPLARTLLAHYTQKILYDDLKGFLGWETAKELCVIKNYVLSINTECR
jgi:LAS superfamily LD-carboxypeptidase LdcB